MSTAIREINAPGPAPRSHPAAGLRVLFVTNLWPDAERPWHGTYVHSQAESLRALGVELDVAVLRGYAGRGAYLRGARAALARNRRRTYDVVHAHYGHSGAVARLELRAPVVLSYCGSDLNGAATDAGGITPRSRAEAAVFRRLAHVCAATITKSAAMADRLPASARARNHVIPNGVDLDRFDPISRARAREMLGWPADEPIALFAGNPALPVKHHALAAAACDRVPVRLEVAFGHDPAMVPVFMSAADVLVLSSRSEGSPNVVKEAMAAELPVVATPVGDVPERLAGVAGCRVCAPEPEALAQGIAAALAHGRSPEAREAVTPLGLQPLAERVADVYLAVR